MDSLTSWKTTRFFLTVRPLAITMLSMPLSYVSLRRSVLICSRVVDCKHVLRSRIDLLTTLHARLWRLPNSKDAKFYASLILWLEGHALNKQNVCSSCRKQDRKHNQQSNESFLLLNPFCCWIIFCCLNPTNPLMPKGDSRIDPRELCEVRPAQRRSSRRGLTLTTTALHIA
jgi:hypothetical protein